jgi:hypothetical protein
MSRGDKPAGIVEGVDELALFETDLLLLCMRDGQIDPQEERVIDRMRALVDALEEWTSRLLILLTNIKGLYLAPAITAMKAKDHLNTYGVNPLATAAD